MCEEAAISLGLFDTTVLDDGQSAGVTYDPPYCYYEGSSLKFNNGMLFGAPNQGSCSTYDRCLCVGFLSPSAPPPPAFWKVGK